MNLAPISTLDGLAIWVGAFFTLCIFSFLYKDNPMYKFAEHVFVGVSAGYGIVIQWYNVVLPNVINKMPWNPNGDWLVIFPALLGILILTRLIPPISWVSRWAIAVMIGTFAGLQIIGYAQGDLIEQIRANFVPLWGDSGMMPIPGNMFSLNGWILFGNWILVVGTITVLVFFFFSKEHKGAIGHTARVGIWVLMISFGASFGYTVMARISLLIGRIQFLLGDWLGLVN